jgi:hypothetical protein
MYSDDDKNLSHHKSDLCPSQRTVVCKRADHADDKTPAANCLMTTARTVVSVLPKNTSIFFVNTYRILDYERSPRMCDIRARLDEDR